MIQIRSQKKRWLAQLAVIVAVVVAAVVVRSVVLRHGNSAPATPKLPYPASGRFDITSGMSEALVRQVAGLPTSKRGACWQYETFRPIRYLVSGRATKNGMLTAVKVCFYSHAVYDVRYQIDGKWPGPDQSHI